MVSKDEVENKVFWGFPYVSLGIKDESLMIFKRGNLFEILIKRSIIDYSIRINGTSLQLVDKTLCRNCQLFRPFKSTSSFIFNVLINKCIKEIGKPRPISE